MKFLRMFFVLAIFLTITNSALSQTARGKPFQQLRSAIDANTALIEKNSQTITNLSADLSSLKLEVNVIGDELAGIKDRMASISADVDAANARMENRAGDRRIHRLNRKRYRSFPFRKNPFTFEFPGTNPSCFDLGRRE